MQRNQTNRVFKRLCKVIPGGVNSPVRACQAMGQLPLVAERGVGDLLYDVDGNSYIDYCGSWGALLHGHADVTILKAVQERMAMGTSFGVTTATEEKLARAIITLMPSIEKIRFVSSGTEATMSAARLARAFTNRPLIIKFNGHYHGHADFFLVKAGSGVATLNPSAMSAGIPPELLLHTASLPFNDTEEVEKFIHLNKKNIAAIILEPIAANMGVVPAHKIFLEMLREETQKIGALLIFDEVITGFRVGLKGAQGFYGINPDLTCLGKIIGGGFPAAAFGGKAEIMNLLAPLGNVYQAGTLSGNPVAMEAGFQAIKKLQRKNFYEALEAKTNILTEPIRDWLHHHKKAPICLQQVGSMFTIFFGAREVDRMQLFDSEKFVQLFRYLFSHGIYIPPLQYEAWFVSMAHKEKNLKRTSDLILKFLDATF